MPGLKRILHAFMVVLAAALAIGLASCSEQPLDHLSRAKKLLSQNDDAGAVLELKSALQNDPELVEGRYLLGSALLRRGDPKAAEVELRKALATGKLDHQVVPELARAMLLLGKESRLIDEFSRTKLDPAKAQADLSTTLALAYAAAGKPDQSSTALADALAADPHHAPARLMQARRIAGKGDFAQALNLVDDVIAKDGSLAAAWVLKGQLQQFGLQRTDDALSTYRKAIGVNTKYLPAHLAAIKLLADGGQLEAAKKQFEELKSVVPNHPVTQLTEARLAFQRGDFKVAREIGQGLLQRAPDNVEVLLLMGGVEFQTGSLRLAEVHLNKVLHAYPGSAHAWRLLQQTHLKSGQPSKALAALEVALGKGELAPDLLALAGEIQLHNGNPAKAEEFFNKALKLDPKNPDTRIALAMTRLSGGRSAQALDELQQIADEGPGIKADLALISTHLRRGELPKALAAIDRMERKVPQDGRTHELRGRVHLAMRDRAAARRSFERALEVQPEFFAAAARLSDMDVEDRNPKAAKSRFEALLARNPRHELALVALAELAANAGAPKDEVLALFNRAIEASPTSMGSKILLVNYLLKMRDAKQALVLAQGAAAGAPENITVLEALGKAQLAAGETQQAVSTFNRIVSLAPQSPAPLLRLAGAYAAANDQKSAERSLRKALEIRPTDRQTQKALVVLLLTQKRTADALSMAATIQKQPGSGGMGHIIEGDIRTTSKDWPAAAAAYRAAIQAQPSTEAAGKLHAVLVNAGKAAEADAHAATWIKSHPKDARFMTELVEAALQRKDLAAAEKTLHSLLAAQPDHPMALNNMAWVAGQLKRPGALAYAEKAKQLAPNQPYILDTLANLLSAAGQHARAVELQRKAVELQPSHATLRMNLARIYVEAGNATEAKTELDTLVKLGQNHPVHAEALALRNTLR